MFEIEDIPVTKSSRKNSNSLSPKEKKSLRAKERYKANRDKILVDRKEYQLKNKENIKKRKHMYYVKNRDVVLTKRKKYCLINKDSIKADKRKNYLENKELINNNRKEYYNKKREDIIEIAKNYRNSVSKSKKQFSRIPLSDAPKFINNVITVTCKKCNKRYAPTYSQISSRIQALKTIGGESNFYCSDICKNSCDIYRFKACIQTDVRSEKRVKERVAKKVRACQDKSLKQSQCDENLNQSYCEKCGDFIDIELHHTLPIAQYGKEAVNSSGHILLCAGCHVKLHNECGKTV